VPVLRSQIHKILQGSDLVALEIPPTNGLAEIGSVQKGKSPAEEPQKKR